MGSGGAQPQPGVDGHWVTGVEVGMDMTQIEFPLAKAARCCAGVVSEPASTQPGTWCLSTRRNGPETGLQATPLSEVATPKSPWPTWQSLPESHRGVIPFHPVCSLCHTPVTITLHT